MPSHPLTAGTSPAGSPRSKISTRAPSRPILAIDYGRRRMGLALSDALGLTARPLAVLHRVNRRRDLAALRDICRRHNVGKVLVGWPLHLDGSEGEMAAETERFAARLRSELRLPRTSPGEPPAELPVELVDERLTTWEARQTQRRQTQRSVARSAAGPVARRLRERSSAPGRPRSTPDDVAAAVILTDYLSRASSSGASANSER